MKSGRLLEPIDDVDGAESDSKPSQLENLSAFVVHRREVHLMTQDSRLKKRKVVCKVSLVVDFGVKLSAKF